MLVCLSDRCVQFIMVFAVFHTVAIRRDVSKLRLQKDQVSSSRIRIYYGDDDNQIVDEDTEYTGRIQVTSDQHGTQLTIQEVQLSDQREFICQVNGLSAGTMESKTHLSVFGEEAQ